MRLIRVDPADDPQHLHRLSGFWFVAGLALAELANWLAKPFISGRKRK
jgi:hypothetical protein